MVNCKPETSPSRRFSRKGPPPVPGAGQGCGGGDRGSLDIFISPELGRGRTAWFPPDAASSSSPNSPAENAWFGSQALLSGTASAFVSWHPARIRQFPPSPHLARALVPISSLALPKPRVQQQSEHTWAPYLDHAMRIQKSEPLKEGRRIGAQETQGWGFRPLHEGRLFSAFWKAPSKSQKYAGLHWSLWRSPKLLQAGKSISHFPIREMAICNRVHSGND